MERTWIDVLAVHYQWAWAIAGALFIGMLGCIEIGFRIERKRAAGESAGFWAGTGVITGALVTLLALILGFSFGTAETRFDRRRQMIIEEANAIGTAYLRVDMLPVREQPVLRDLFRKYLDARLEVYANVPEVEKATSKLAQASDISAEIWERSERASRGRTAAELLALPAINTMIDIAAARKAVLFHHVPLLIIALLVGLALACSVMIGYRTSIAMKRNLLAAILFALVVSGTFYVILDLEFPRVGLIRLDLEDRILYDLREDLRQR